MVKDLSLLFYGLLLIAAIYSASLTGCVVVPADQGVPAAAPADVNYNNAVDPLPPEEVYNNAPVEAPPPLQFSEPPDVVAVPSGDSNVYMVPNMTGVYFYNNFWYRYDRGYWFRSSIYNGPWGYVEQSFVPRIIVSVPPEYPRYLPRDYQRIHYHDFNNHWKSWDHDRYWQKQDWYKRESRADVRRERYSLIKAEREKRHFEGQRSRGGDHHPPPETHMKPDTHMRPDNRVKPETHTTPGPYVKPETHTTPGAFVKPEARHTPGPYVKPEAHHTPGPYVKPETRHTPGPYVKPEIHPTSKPYVKPGEKPASGNYVPAARKPAPKQPETKQHEHKKDEKVNER